VLVLLDNEHVDICMLIEYLFSNLMKLLMF